MKKLLLSVFALLISSAAFAQLCTPDLSIQGSNALIQDAVTLSPDSGVLADMTDNEPYNDVLFFVFENSGDIGPVSFEIEQVKINSLDNLPDGLTLEYVSGRPDDNVNGVVNPNNPTFRDPSNSPDNGPYGCVTISGTPTGVTQDDLEPGTDSLIVTLNLTVTAVGQEVTENAPISFRYLGVSGRPAAYLKTVNLSLSPNPATDEISLGFTANNTQDMTFEVYDIQGRKTNLTSTGTFHPGDHNVTLDVSSLSNGMYFVKSVVGETVYTQKFLKR